MSGADVSDLIAEFKRQLPDKVAALSALFHAKDMLATAKLAHQLKGATAIYGFKELAVICGKIEENASAAVEADLTKDESQTSSEVHKILKEQLELLATKVKQ